MNKLALFLLTFLISTNLFAEISLFTSESDEGRPVSDMYSILKKFSEKHNDRNILFYIHGRKKLLSNEISRMKKLEAIYNLNVVMLHWNSYSTMFDRPLNNAEAASDAAFEGFQEIQRFENDFPEYTKSHSINLLTHSMGNLIIKYAVEKFYSKNENYQKIFNNFISTGADVPLKGHRDWLSKFQLADQNYIMMNNRDIVLMSSYFLDLTDQNPFSYRLGLGFDNYVGWDNNIKNKLVPTAKYIDFSKILIFDHGYFLSKNFQIKNIFHNLFYGRDPFEVSKENNFFKFKQDNQHKNIYTILN